MRRLLCWIGFLGALAACGPEPEPFDPTKPHRYRVLRGDTWQSISSKREVDIADIKEWNALREDHKLIPGQYLWVFPQGKGAPKEGEHPALAAARYNDPEGEPPKVKPLRRPAPPAADGADGVADADDHGAEPVPQADAGSADAAPGTQTIDTEGYGPGGTALLSLLDEADPSPKLEPVPSIARDAAPIDSVLGARRGGLGGGGEVDNAEVAIDRVVKAPEPGPAGPKKIPTLPKAEPKRCLAEAPDVELGDHDIASTGLDKKAIKTGMRPVLYAAQACLPGGGEGPHELHLEVSIGCDGLVYDTRMVKSAGLPEPVTSCVEAVADQASFAAASGATTFLYPVILGY